MQKGKGIILLSLSCCKDLLWQIIRNPILKKKKKKSKTVHSEMVFFLFAHILQHLMTQVSTLQEHLKLHLGLKMWPSSQWAVNDPQCKVNSLSNSILCSFFFSLFVLSTPVIHETFSFDMQDLFLSDLVFCLFRTREKSRSIGMCSLEYVNMVTKQPHHTDDSKDFKWWW